MSFISNLVNTITGSKTQPQTIPEPDEIIKEATQWIGLDENSPGIDTFRKAVNNEANGEAWCAAFVMYCARAVGLRHNIEPSLYPSELCYTIWQRSPVKCRIDAPVPGSIVIWNYPDTQNGHTGIVTEVLNDGWMNTIEGNTTSGTGNTTHGVFRKLRTISGGSGMRVLGYLLPFI